MEFTTFTQFSNQFDNISTFGRDRSACPFFALLSANNFLITGDISQKSHENNIFEAINNYVIYNPPKYLGFTDLIAYSQFDPNLICGTTPELVYSGVVSWQHFFPSDSDKNYATIFLKNTNFFVVLVNVKEKLYAVRDCHMETQRTFTDFNKLCQYLSTTYRFETPTVVGGVAIPEFDNIEWLTLF